MKSCGILFVFVQGVVLATDFNLLIGEGFHWDSCLLACPLFKGLVCKKKQWPGFRQCSILIRHVFPSPFAPNPTPLVVPPFQIRKISKLLVDADFDIGAMSNVPKEGDD